MADTFHPAFPQPDNPEAVVWRYMDFWKFEWLVGEGRLYMPSASKLGDPFEGTAPHGEIAWWDNAISEAGTPEQRSVLTYNKDILSRFRASFREQMYYVSCWHMSAFESGAMWRAYATTAESVSVRTTYRALQEALPPFVMLGRVRYIDYRCDRLPSLNLFEAVTHKDRYYAFEQEVRAVALPPATPEMGLNEFQSAHFEASSEPGTLVYAPLIDVRRLVHAIVLHPNATADFEQEVEQFCVAHALPAPEKSKAVRVPLA